MPVHGEYHQLVAHSDTAEMMGIPKKDIFMMENGKATVNGVEYELTPRSGNTDSPIFLFSNGYAMDEGNFKGKFYDAKIYEGDELIAHFKPNTEGNLTQLIH